MGRARLPMAEAVVVREMRMLAVLVEVLVVDRVGDVHVDVMLFLVTDHLQNLGKRAVLPRASHDKSGQYRGCKVPLICTKGGKVYFIN